MENIKATLYLKSGQRFDILIDGERQIGPNSLTLNTVQSFLRPGDGEGLHKVIVQGDNIACIDVHDK